MDKQMNIQLNAIKAKYQAQLEEQKDKLYDLYETHFYSHNYLLQQVKKYIKGQFKHVESIQYKLPCQSKGNIMYGNVKVFLVVVVATIDLPTLWKLEQLQRTKNIKSIVIFQLKRQFNF